MSRAAAVSLLERCFEAFNAGDRAALLESLADDVAFDFDQRAREIGQEKVRWLLALRAGHFRDGLSDLVIMTDEGGGRAAAEFTLRGIYVASADGLPEASGQSYSLPAGIFVEIDDGLITRLSVHFNAADFIAQLSRG